MQRVRTNAYSVINQSRKWKPLTHRPLPARERVHSNEEIDMLRQTLWSMLIGTLSSVALAQEAPTALDVYPPDVNINKIGRAHV